MGDSQGQSKPKRSIHTILAVRLAVAALVITTVLGLTVFFRERNKVGEAIAERPLQGARHFNAKITYLLDVPGPPDHEGLQLWLSFAPGSHVTASGLGSSVSVLRSDRVHL